VVGGRIDRYCFILPILCFGSMKLFYVVPTIFCGGVASTASTTHAFQTAPPFPLAAAASPSRSSNSRRSSINRWPNPPRLLLPSQCAMGFDVDDLQSPSSPTTISSTSTASSPFQLSDKEIDFQSLFVMDIVLFQRRFTNDNDSSSSVPLELGAVQENGNVAPLSTWTLESAYTTSTNTEMLQFVVDENDIFPGLTSQEIQVHMVLDGSVISYGSRQVGGGKGPGNPHGEESELIYYIDRNVVEGEYHYARTTKSLLDDDDVGELSVDVVVDPKLEHLW